MREWLRRLRPLGALATVGFVHAATPSFHRAYALRGALLPMVLAPFLLSLGGNVASDAGTKRDAVVAMLLFIAALATSVVLRPQGAGYILLLIALSVLHAYVARRITLLGGAIGALSVALMTAWYSNVVGGTGDHVVSDAISAFLFVGSYEVLKAGSDERHVLASSTLALIGALYTLIIATLLTRYFPAKVLACTVSAMFVGLGFKMRRSTERVLPTMRAALLLGIVAMYFE